MTYKCTCCGEVHDELVRYTSWQIPKLDFEDALELSFDSDYTCSLRDKRHFISCEVEVPFADIEEPPLGLICWVEVATHDYERYIAYRGRKKERGEFRDWIHGTLANPVPAVSESLGTKVKFEVIKGDPTPYVVWVESGSSLSLRIEKKADLEFWHEIHGIATKS